jgi:hypothetical protein
MLEPSLVGRQGPALQGSWRRMGEFLAPCLDMELVCRSTRSVGYRQPQGEKETVNGCFLRLAMVKSDSWTDDSGKNKVVVNE